MKLLATLLSAALCALPATVKLSNTVLVQNVSRIGINLGTWTSWGADQLSSNVIKNPGFEGNIDRAIVVVRNSSPGSFEDDQNWLGRPDGFWTGAQFDVRSGAHKGQTGQIVDSRAKDSAGFPALFVSGEAAFDPGDVITLTRTNDDELPANWWFNPSTGASFSPDKAETRPGSPGKRSLRVRSTASQPAELDSYLDAIGQRAGKLLPIEGKWTLSFWTRLEAGSAALHVSFKRDQSLPFLYTSVPVSSKWQHFAYPFEATDKGPAGILDLRFEVVAPNHGEILLDDVTLRSSADDGVFRKEPVAVLTAMHPAYLRDWEGQLGDTFDNRIAGDFARRTTRYRPGSTSEVDFSYGLRDFLSLAEKLGASPWIIVPTTFSDGECADLGRFLAGRQPVSHNREVLVEFGNENWNSLFRPAGIINAQSHGTVADQCFDAIHRNAGSVPLRTVINAQHANPSAALDFAAASRQADIVAVAPYFLTSLNTGLAPASVLPTLFAGDGDRLLKISRKATSLHKETAVYEVNFHTDGGTAKDDERTAITSGAVSGAALATRLLDTLALGVKRQCVYSLAGFDNRSAAGPDQFVRLWGVTRDLATADHIRPSGLAVVMLNAALAGNMVQTSSMDPAIHSYGFRTAAGWSAVLTSTAATQTNVRVEFPAGGKLPETLQTLASASPFATNEESTQVRIESHPLLFESRTATVTIPAGGLVTLVEAAR